MGLPNLPHIQYTERLAECLIDNEHVIKPWRSRRVRKHFSAAKLLQYADEHVLLRGTLKRRCVVCVEAKKKHFMCKMCNLPNVYGLFHTISHPKINKATFAKTKSYLLQDVFLTLVVFVCLQYCWDILIPGYNTVNFIRK